MFSIYSLLFAICSAIFSCTSADTTVCSREFVIKINDNKTEYITPVFALNYNKNDLAVYNHSENALVNLYLQNASLIFKGHVNDVINNVIYDGKRIETDVAGLATLGENNYGQIVLKDCKFFLIKRKHSIIRNVNFSRTLQNLLKYVNKCFSESKLCSDMGVINSDHFSRAKANPKTFDSINMILQKGIKKKAIVVEDCIADSIIKGLAQKYNQTRGLIEIPAINSYPKINNGSFGNLNQLQRVYNIHPKSRNSTSMKNTKIVSFSFGLPKADVIYQFYSPIPFGAPTYNLRIKIMNMIFFAKISIDYSENPCRIELHDFQVPFKGLVYRVFKDEILTKQDSTKSWMQSIWNQPTVNIVADDVRATLKNYIDKGNFLCENCKSSFN